MTVSKTKAKKPVVALRDLGTIPKRGLEGELMKKIRGGAGCSHKGSKCSELHVTVGVRSTRLTVVIDGSIRK